MLHKFLRKVTKFQLSALKPFSSVVKKQFWGHDALCQIKFRNGLSP